METRDVVELFLEDPEFCTFRFVLGLSFGTMGLG